MNIPFCLGYGMEFNNSSVVSWASLMCLKLQSGTKRTSVFNRKL